MVSSAQLHHAQGVLAGAVAYRDGLEELLARAAVELDPQSPFYFDGRKGRVALIVMSADGGMCGSFNSKIIKEMSAAMKGHSSDMRLFTLGKKVGEAAGKESKYKVSQGIAAQVAKITFDQVATFASELTTGFLKGRFSRVEVLYSDFKTVSSQHIRRAVLLPLTPPDGHPTGDYIVEPSVDELASALLPMLVGARLYNCLASNLASEHASRMTAMQLATENADELLEDLQLTYNKLRQQNITSELLDIVGSSFA